MLSRRDAVLNLGAAVLGTAALPAFALAEAPLAASGQNGLSSSQGDAQAVENRLAREIARVAFRADSEEGVPVLLACVNQVVDQRTRHVPPVTLTPWNAELASEMRRSAAAWEQLRPGCSASDVAHLVQILAERNLSSGRREQKA